MEEEKIYDVELTITDKETGKSITGKTNSKLIDEMDRLHSVVALNELYNVLLEDFLKEGIEKEE
jgi:hypothetical protein